MGSFEPIKEEPKIEEANLDIYICGDINKENFDVLNKMLHLDDYNFEKEIKLKKNEQNKYYTPEKFNCKFSIKEYSFKNNGEDDKKIYNIFFFKYDKIDYNFAKVLCFYLLENDSENERKNVIISFGFEDIIKKAIKELKDKCPVAVPFLIFIGNYEYTDNLDYENYIPNINTLKKFLRENEQNMKEDNINKNSRTIFYEYLAKKLYRICAYYNQMGFNLNLVEILNGKNTKINFNLNIALMGHSGGGKSTLLNLVFNELVSRTSASSKDVTTKCSEYYLPIKNNYEKNNENIGQIRFIDFPGVSEEKCDQEQYIINTIEEYKKNSEQIDIVLFYIDNGMGRELSSKSLKLIKFLNEYKIKILFIINGGIDKTKFDIKKTSLKSAIDNDEIINEDFNNIISADYYQFFDKKKREGISNIFEKIKEIIKIKDTSFNVNSLSRQNYLQQFDILRKSSRVFEAYNNLEEMIESIKIKAYILVTGYSLATVGTSFLTMVVPIVDSVLAYTFQYKMIAHLLELYGFNSDEYDKLEILLSGGNTIKKKANAQVEEYLTNSAKLVTNTAVFGGKEFIQKQGTNAAEIIAEKTITTSTKKIIKDTTLSGFQFVTETASKEIGKNYVTVGKISVETAKEGIKKTSTTIASESSWKWIGKTTQNTVQEVTEEVIIKQSGSNALVNLGKVIPYVGVAINGTINTYSTLNIGNKLICYLDGEMQSPEKRINLIKKRVFALENICHQIDDIIKQNQ